MGQATDGAGMWHQCGLTTSAGAQRMNELSMGSGNTIRLAERRVFSHSFKPLYDEGMGLVEQTAEYLDGQGRVDAKRLSRLAATLYAAKSMRLTTRLMQVASWLLLQRAANSGEMTRDQVAAEKSKVRLDTASAREDAAGWGELPNPSSISSIVRSACRRLSAAWMMRSMASIPTASAPWAVAAAIPSPTRSCCSTRLSRGDSSPAPRAACYGVVSGLFTNS